MTEPGTGTTRSDYAPFDGAQSRTPAAAGFSSSTTPRRPTPSSSCSPPTSPTAVNRPGPRALRTRTRGPRLATSTATTSSRYASPYYSLYVLSGQVPKNRLVAIGTMDVPWGMTAGAKFVIESPKANTGSTAIGTAPRKIPIRRTASTTTTSSSRSFRRTTIGYMALDLQADEVVRVRQRIGHPVPPRRAQCHESRELRSSYFNTFRRRRCTSRTGTSRACRARSSSA